MVTKKTRLASALLAVLMVVSMLTTFALPAVAEDDLSSYPSITKYSENPNAEGYTVSTVEEWNSIGINHQNKGLTTSQTLHITADLDFKGKAATTINQLRAKIDGHGHTISNIADQATPLFGDHRGALIENLIFKNCSMTLTTANASQAYYKGFLLQMAYTSTTFRSIDFINCTVGTKVATSGISLIVGCVNGSKTLTFEDILIEDCAVKAYDQGEKWGIGFLIAKAYEQSTKPTLVVDGLVMNNNTITPQAQGGNGILFGELKDIKKATIKNVGIFNTVNTVSSKTVSVIANSGAAPESGLTLENVLVGGNTDGTNLSVVPVTSASNLYSDISYNGTSYTTEQVLCGEAAYWANQNPAEGAKKWEYVSGSGYPTFDTDDKGLPFPVDVTVTNGMTGETKEKITVYTDTEGKLIAPTNVVFADPNKVYTNGDTATATWWPLVSDLVSEQTTYSASTGFIINSVAELEAAGNNAANFTANQTLYLTANLNLAGSAFAGFSELKASFDGGKHTISNWNSDGAFFRSYKGTSVKDLTLDGVTVTVSAGQKGILFDSYAVTGVLNVKNVHLNSCTLTVNKRQWHYGCMFGIVTKGTVNISGCTVNECKVTSGASYAIGNAGIVIGTIRDQGTVNITDFILQNSEMSAYSTKDDTMGIAIGSVEKSSSAGTLNINNMAVIGNKRLYSGMNKFSRGILIGVVKDSAKADINNVILLNNDQAAANQTTDETRIVAWETGYTTEQNKAAWDAYNPVMYFDETADATNSRISNVYTNKDDLADKITQENCEISVTAADYGAIAYAINNNLSVTVNNTTTTLKSTNRWEVTADGKLVLDTDGKGLPAKITLQIDDPAGSTVFYTDVNGHLMGTNPYLDGDGYYYAWRKDLTGVFTEDETVMGTKLTLTDLQAKIAELESKNSDYYTNDTETTLAEALAEAKEKIEKKSYKTLDEITEAYNSLGAYKYKEDAMVPMSDYEKYSDAPNFTISTVTELEDAGTNVAKFTADQTLYLTANLDLTGSAFAGFDTLYASFDGGGKTISNWNSDGAFFRSYKGTSVKDLTLDNVTVTVSDGQKGILFDSYTGTGTSVLNVENVHLNSCTLTVNAAKKYHIGSMFGIVTKGTVNISGCTVNGGKVTSGTSNNTIGNAGIVIGTIRDQGTVNITDFILKNSKMYAYSVDTAVSMGLAIGSVEKSSSAGTLNINNMAVIGNERQNSALGWYCRSILIGGVKDSAKVDINNVILLDNDQAAANQNTTQINDDKDAAGWGAYNPVMNIKTSADVTNSRISNVYTNMDKLADNITPVGGKVNVTKDDYGAIAYAINKNLSVTVKADANNTLTSTNKWTVDTNGDLVVAGENDTLPVAVTLQAEDARFNNRNLKTVLYTNTKGKLIGLDKKVTIAEGDEVDLLRDVDWTGEVSATATYTKEVTITGVLKSTAPYYTVTAPETAKDGDTINVTLAITNNPGFASADISVTYDPKMLAFNNAAGTTNKVEPNDNKDGTVTIKVTAAEGSAITGGNAFVTLTFTVNKPTNGGEATISVKGNVTNASGSDVAVYEGRATVNVKSSLPTLEVVENADGYQGHQVEVLVNITQNDNGVRSGALDVTYDTNVMTLVSAEAVDWNAQVEVDTNTVTVKGTETLSSNGTLVKLIFNIKEDAALGNTTVKVAANAEGFADGNNNPVTVLGGEGTVTVSSVVSGDINGDNLVDIVDAVRMLRVYYEYENTWATLDARSKAAADVYGKDGKPDGKVDVDDVIRVLQHLNGSNPL